jgi:hypothetical protein
METEREKKEPKGNVPVGPGAVGREELYYNRESHVQWWDDA